MEANPQGTPAPGHLRNESPNASVYLIALKAYTFHWGTYSETVRVKDPTGNWPPLTPTGFGLDIEHHWALGRFAAVFTDGPVVDRLNLGENLETETGKLRTKNELGVKG